jgi:hypothetical protein
MPPPDLGHFNRPLQSPGRPAVGSETLLDRSAPTIPSWAREPVLKSDRESLYFVGICANQPSLARGRDCAFADAMVALARSLGTVYRVAGETLSFVKIPSAPTFEFDVAVNDSKAEAELRPSCGWIPREAPANLQRTPLLSVAPQNSPRVSNGTLLATAQAARRS